MPTPTFTLIASNTLSSSQSSVTFDSIPQTYTDLVLRFSIRDGYVGGGNPNAFQTSFWTFNGSTSGYSRRSLFGNGSSAVSQNGSSQTSLYQQWNTSDGATANTFSNGEIYIPNYAASIVHPVSNFTAQENNDASAYIVASAHLWNTASAITQIVVTNGAGQLVAGSSFYLYGIKNS